MNKISNVPQIRFKGFTDAWEQRKLSEVIEYRNGKGKEDKQSSSGKYELINLNSISIDGGLKTSGKFVDDSDDLLQINDLVMILSDVGKGNLLGRVAIIPESNKYVLNQRVALLRPVNSDMASFLFVYINAHQYYFKAKGAGMSQLNISKDAVQNFCDFMPGTKEQLCIGDFFSNVDRLITLHQRKYDQVVNFKKAMLEKMFPQDGKDIPNIRFKNFRDAWEQRKLSEVADRFDNLRVPISASDRIPGETPYYGANGIQDFVEGYTHDGEFLLVAEDGANDLEDYPVNYVNGKIWVNNHAHVIQSKPNIAINSFLMYAIKQVRMSQFIVGGGRAKLNAEVMMSLPIIIPDINEQLLIGDYFQKIDKLITLHQCKLQQLKNIKKALLEKMFV